MSNATKQDLQVLEELIRRVDDYLDPSLANNDFSYLYQKDIRDRLYGKYPKCFLKIKGVGREIPTLLPICNRHGHKDARVINIARKVVQKLMSNTEGAYDVNELNELLSKLDRMYNVYSKDIPKPPEAAGRKSYITRMMNNITRHLDTYKGN